MCLLRLLNHLTINKNVAFETDMILIPLFTQSCVHVYTYKIKVN